MLYDWFSDLLKTWYEIELNNLESAFDLQELLGTDNEGAGSISRGVFPYRGVAEKRKDSEDDCDTPTKRIKGSKKKVAKKSPRKKSKQRWFEKGLVIMWLPQTHKEFRLGPNYFK